MTPCPLRSPCLRRPRLSLGVALLCVLAAAPAQAVEAPFEHRYAVVIGSNLGDPDEAPLSWAERDATRMAEVLARMARVSEENLVLLRGASKSAVERVIGDIASRIARQRIQDPNTAAMLFVYYSGHASVGALHLDGERLTFSTLKALVAAAGAEVSVFVVDACRSGGLTRVKGAVPAEPFEIQVEDKLDSSGLAIITSSAAGEDAQESERLQGGIFTHHFINGLIGAADASKDERITLSEAYRYAYTQTLRTTSRTRFVQHPTYAFKMKGRQEVILTRIGGAAGFGRLELSEAGFYVLMEQARGGEVVAELEAASDTDVLLPRGTYLVRRRGNRAVEEATVVIDSGRTTVLSAADMERIPYGRTVRKGLTRSDSVWSLGAAFELAGPTRDNLSVGTWAALYGQLDTEALALRLSLRYGRSTAANPDLALTQDMLGLDLGAYKIFDVGATPLGIGLGVRLGLEWFHQSFETTGVAPSRQQLAGRAAPVLRVELTPAPAFALTLDCGADIYVLEGQGSGGVASIETPVVPFCALGASAYLP